MVKMVLKWISLVYAISLNFIVDQNAKALYGSEIALPKPINIDSAKIAKVLLKK
jgi:hypothetical protein